MAQVRVPTNVSSITLATSGVLVPVANIITCTANEATLLNHPAKRICQISSLGAISWAAGGNIVAITINGKVQNPPVNGGDTSANGLNSLDVANFFNTTPEQRPFQLIIG